MGRGFRCAREKRVEDRLYPAHRLFLGRHGVRDGVRQEVRHQDHTVEGSFVGGGSRQARERRARRRARALRTDLRGAVGHRRAEEGHGHPDEPQPQRPGRHALQQAEREGSEGRREPEELIDREKGEYTFAQTFPTGTHAMWIYYWLAAHGIHPFNEVKAIVVPPPQMVANMRVRNMDGFCVGEPWNTRPTTAKLGSTPTTTPASLQ